MDMGECFRVVRSNEIRNTIQQGWTEQTIYQPKQTIARTTILPCARQHTLRRLFFLLSLSSHALVHLSLSLPLCSEHVLLTVIHTHTQKWKDVNNNNCNATTTSAPCSCPICLTSFQDNDMVSSCQSCRQPYHRHCLQEWLGKADGCPTCRVVFVTTTSSTQEEEEEYETRATTNEERRSSSSSPSSFSSPSSSKTTNRYEQ